MSGAYDLGDYNDVASRIQEFRERYPTGSLQPADPARPYAVETVGDKVFLVVVAAAYRTPDDPRPGIGMAMEPLPGATPYTRGSELQNAETSAWGRALIAVGAADARKGIASAEEVVNRRPARAPRKAATSTKDKAPDEPKLISDPQLRKIMVLMNEAGIVDREQRLRYCAEIAGRPLTSSKDLTQREAGQVIDSLEQAVNEPYAEDPA